MKRSYLGAVVLGLALALGAGAIAQQTTVGGLPASPTFRGAVTANGTAPVFRWRESDASASNGNWRFVTDAEGAHFQVCDDSWGSCSSMLSFDRTGTTRDTINLQATNVQVNGGAVGAIARVKPSNTTRTSTTTFADDPHLAGIALAASSNYVVTVYAHVAVTATAEDFKMQLAYSGTMTAGNCFRSHDNQSGTGITRVITNWNSQLNLSSTVAFAEAGIILTCGLRTSTAGNLSLQWAQVVSGGGGTTLEAGSHVSAVPAS